jgi:hypothetical protein
MFGWLRGDPKKKLEAHYAKKLEEARDAQRSGDIQGYATLTAEAETILQEIDRFAKEVEKAGG